MLQYALQFVVFAVEGEVRECRLCHFGGFYGCAVVCCRCHKSVVTSLVTQGICQTQVQYVVRHDGTFVPRDPARDHVMKKSSPDSTSASFDFCTASRSVERLLPKVMA